MLRKEDNTRKHFCRIMAVLFSAMLMFSLCSCIKNKDVEEDKSMQSIEIVSEEYNDGSPVRDKRVVSEEYSLKIIDMLCSDNLVFSDEYLKLEPEKSYTIIISEHETYQINREPNGQSMYYVFRNNAGSITGTWVPEEVIILIEEAISTQ